MATRFATPTATTASVATTPAHAHRARSGQCAWLSKILVALTIVQSRRHSGSLLVQVMAPSSS